MLTQARPVFIGIDSNLDDLSHSGIDRYWLLVFPPLLILLRLKEIYPIVDIDQYIIHC